MSFVFLKSAYFISLCLFFIGLYLNQGPYNVAFGLLLLTSLLTCLIKPKEFISFVKGVKAAYALLAVYFVLYLAINFYHFGFNADFQYAIKRARWILFAFVFLPSFYIHFNFSKESFFKYFKILLFLVIGLYTLILVDSISRVFFLKPSLSLFLQSSVEMGGVHRVSWTYNAIPFSKLLFFLFLFSFLTTTYIKNRVYKAILLFISISSFALTILTLTRASWVGIVLCLPLIFFLGIKSNKFKFLLAAFAGVTICLVLLALSLPNNYIAERLYSFKENKSISNQYRIEHWKANLKLSFDNPIIGVGYASNRKPEVLEKYIFKFTGNKKILFGHPHNEYLDILSGMGYLMLGIFLLVLGIPVLYGLKVYEKNLPVMFSVVFLNFMYVTAFFDKITLTSWGCILFCWAIIFTFYAKSNGSLENNIE